MRYPVWPDLAKFLHFGKWLNIFGNIFNVYLVLGKIFNSLWHNLYAIGHIFIAKIGQILNTQFGHLVTMETTNLNAKVITFLRNLFSRLSPVRNVKRSVFNFLRKYWIKQDPAQVMERHVVNVKNERISNVWRST